MASKQRLRDEEGAEKQRRAYKRTWRDEKGAECSLHERLEATNKG